jgi:hypothetical protein
MQSGEYDIEKCNQEQKASLALKLSKIGALSCQELHQAPKHGLGYEKMPRDSIRSVTPSLPEGVVLIAFRFWRKAPMVGYRCPRGAFHILWLDRDFSLYNHS